MEKGFENFRILVGSGGWGMRFATYVREVRPSVCFLFSLKRLLPVSIKSFVI